jgi:hypothetical protein
LSESQEINLSCMIAEGTLPRSQGPASGPCPEPDETMSHSQTLFLRYIITVSSTPEVFRVVSTLRVFRQKFCTHLSSLPCILHATPA